VKKGCQEIMIIKKIFKLIGKTNQNSLKNRNPAINSVEAKSTLIGRSKVISLKKMVRERKGR
jgi:hypothetical protein